MIIIVEGIDRVGKSTLCKMLSDELNIPLHKYNGIVNYKDMKNIEETDKILSAINIIDETKSSIIFDRLNLTDYVYGVLERNYGIVAASRGLFLIDKKLSSLDDVFLILVEPVNVEKSSKEHGKDLTAHKKMFDEAFKESKIKNKWKCTYNTLSEAIMFIKTTIEKKEE